MVNKVVLLGIVEEDIELRLTKARKAVVNFDMSTVDHWMETGGERVSRRELHRVTVWGDQAKLLARHCKAGSVVSIVGRLQSANRTKDGTRRVRVIATEANPVGDPRNPKGVLRFPRGVFGNESVPEAGDAGPVEEAQGPPLY